MNLSISNTLPYNDAWKAKTGPLGFKMCNDYLFRMLLQEDPDTLKAIIASFMHVSIDEIEQVTVINPIVPGESVDDKEIRLDINVIMNMKKPINIEMQAYNHTGWIERSVLYACRGFDTLTHGDKYTDNMGFWQISFCDFCIFKEHPVFYRSFVLTSTDNEHIQYSDKLMLSNVDLTNIELADEEDIRYGLVDWARLFKAESWEELKMLAENNQTIDKAISSVWQMTEDERIRDRMQRREDGERLWKFIEKKAEQAEKRADEADRRANEADKRANEADRRSDQAEKTIEEQNELIRELRDKLAAYENN